MRIALIVPGGIGRDGVHLVIPALLSLIRRLARDHTLLVVGLEQEERPASYDLYGARVICLGRDGGRGPRITRRYSRLMGVLRDFRPDLLHAFWLSSTSTLALLAGRALGAPVLASLGGGELVGLRQIGYGGRLSALARLHVAVALRGARAVSAGSRYALAPLLPRRPDARWLPLGAESAPEERGERGDPPSPQRSAGPPWRLLHVASINRVKGPEVLLGALAIARAELRSGGHGAEPLLLDWVGFDTLDGAAQRMAGELGLGDAVRFHGWRPHADALALCRQAHLYVQSSYHESQGVAVCEAAVAGLPTVGSAVGLAAELAPAAALTTPPGDAAGLARALVGLLGDERRRLALGRAARAWAQAHDAGWTARQFTRIYEEIRP
jgi:glycosyltransferase involved in cell wall biosynthesis